MAKLKETTVRENLYVKGDVYVYDFELGQYRLLFAPATENTLGGIIVGNNLTIDAKGVLNSIRQPVDKELSLLSANPVENQTVTQALNTKVDKSIASEAATSENRLLDRESVETIVSTNNSVFRGSFDTWTAVPIDSEDYEPDDDGNKVPKKNDYMIVNDASDYHEEGSAGKIGTWRFIYNKSWRVAGKLGWKPQYKMSDSFDSKQKAALNSGITQAKVETYDAYAAQIQNKSDLGHTHSAVDIKGLKPIATSGEFTDIYNIPTAGNSTTPVYFGTDPVTKTGRQYACSFTIPNPTSGRIGETYKPVYFKVVNGLMQPVACDIEINKNTGNSVTPVYIDANGKLTQCSFSGTSVVTGAKNRPIYYGSRDNKIQPIECDIEINPSTGNSINPVYIDANGKFVACNFTIETTVPRNAVFTDENVNTDQSIGKFYIAGPESANDNTNGTLKVNPNVYIENGKLYASQFIGPVSGSVAWDNITGKPTSYPPSSHNHDSSYLKLSGGTLTGAVTSTSTFKATMIPIVTQSTPTVSSNNGWYKCTKTINGINHSWMILKVDELFIAHSLNDARIVFQSIDNLNWYSPYASWHV